MRFTGYYNSNHKLNTHWSWSADLNVKTTKPFQWTIISPDYLWNIFVKFPANVEWGSDFTAVSNKNTFLLLEQQRAMFWPNHVRIFISAILYSCLLSEHVFCCLILLELKIPVGRLRGPKRWNWKLRNPRGYRRTVSIISSFITEEFEIKVSNGHRFTFSCYSLHSQLCVPTTDD